MRLLKGRADLNALHSGRIVPASPRIGPTNCCIRVPLMQVPMRIVPAADQHAVHEHDSVPTTDQTTIALPRSSMGGIKRAPSAGAPRRRYCRSIMINDRALTGFIIYCGLDDCGSDCETLIVRCNLASSYSTWVSPSSGTHASCHRAANF
jgi:hypothetical protein